MYVTHSSQKPGVEDCSGWWSPWAEIQEPAQWSLVIFVKGFLTVFPCATGKSWKSHGTALSVTTGRHIAVVTTLNYLIWIHVTREVAVCQREGHRCLAWSRWTEVMKFRKSRFPSSSCNVVFPSRYDLTPTSWDLVQVSWPLEALYLPPGSGCCFWGCLPFQSDAHIAFGNRWQHQHGLWCQPVPWLRAWGLRTPIVGDRSWHSPLFWDFLMAQTWGLCCGTLEKRSFAMGEGRGGLWGFLSGVSIP